MRVLVRAVDQRELSECGFDLSGIGSWRDVKCLVESLRVGLALAPRIAAVPPALLILMPVVVVVAAAAAAHALLHSLYYHVAIPTARFAWPQARGSVAASRRTLRGELRHWLPLLPEPSFAQ
mmetsp:Transcript_35348/g.88180  ORF Transcript_35348/g.88180 Transcript_35348/m.88180 type:complete len:122 (-) Transcript_35348:402-767(-)